jgi:hypothetical protein
VIESRINRLWLDLSRTLLSILVLQTYIRNANDKEEPYVHMR